MQQPSSELKKVLRPVHLWAIAVGLVISGEYFGWNYGWGVAGTGGFLIATLIVTILYVTFIFSFTELTTSIPHAGGPFAYGFRAFGKWGGLIAGYATLIEFLITPPAIAFALGNYAHFLHQGFPVLGVALGSYVVFIAINWLGIKESALLSLTVTLLAVVILVVYIAIVSKQFSWERFYSDPMPYGWEGVFSALPFAIWFYQGMEGVAMVAEEVHDPKRTIYKGYGSGMVTLVLLVLGVMIFTGGVAHWKDLSTIDYPLPAVIGILIGKDHAFTRLFAILGLFGLIASFHGTLIGCSRQIFALARSGYLPSFMGAVNKKFQTPHWALMVTGVIGCVALTIGRTDQIIILSALGAIVMYMISLAALFVLRKKEPDLERPFRVPFFPWFPMIAMVLATLCLCSIVWYNQVLSWWFLIGLITVAGIFLLSKKKFVFR